MQELFSDSIGGRLKIARRTAGLTLEQLATKTGYALTTLSSIENGHDKPSTRLLDALIQALEVKREWIVTGKGSMEGAGRRAKVMLIIPEADLKAERERAERYRDEIAALQKRVDDLEEQLRFSERYHKEKKR
jgi:transcriptional regulator with XRE-family HTH domain